MHGEGYMNALFRVPCDNLMDTIQLTSLTLTQLWVPGVAQYTDAFTCPQGHAT